ncbi:hypothetical protein COY27_06400 [Candidatus Woesearchaeota archaeon CG_4_10_14_0_2_um_filter_33_13]|nr:MAG: hypothetical protein COY27_06400 [Candidatus Woesearchaeota archaeon CG_4_10_14_0_2_um_filter_33_13]
MKNKRKCNVPDKVRIDSNFARGGEKRDCKNKNKEQKEFYFNKYYFKVLVYLYKYPIEEFRLRDIVPSQINQGTWYNLLPKLIYRDIIRKGPDRIYLLNKKKLNDYLESSFVNYFNEEYIKKYPQKVKKDEKNKIFKQLNEPHPCRIFRDKNYLIKNKKISKKNIRNTTNKMELNVPNFRRKMFLYLNSTSCLKNCKDFRDVFDWIARISVYEQYDPITEEERKKSKREKFSRKVYDYDYSKLAIITARKYNKRGDNKN